MHVVHQEDALPEPGQDLPHPGAIEAGLRARRYTLEPLENALLVALRLEPSQEPCACVGKALVVEIDRVLGGENDPHAVGASLLEERDEWSL